MAGRGGGKGKISYVQQSEPSFISAFKQRVGYKEGPTVDTKRTELELSDGDDQPEGEDEKPVVVVLRKGDLTAEEADRLQENSSDDVQADGKILFRKPVKRNAEKTEEESPETKDNKKKKKKKSSKDKKASSLLSFDDDDENDDT